MDIPKDFTLSYHALMNNKVIILPRLVSCIITIGIILILLFASGLYGVVKQYSFLVNKYQHEHKSITGQSNSEDLSKYLEANGLSLAKFAGLLSWKNAVLLIISISAIIIINYYLSTVLLVMASLVVKNKKLDYNLIIGSSFKMMLRLAWYHFLVIIAMAVPVILMILVVILFFAVNKWLGILSLIAVVILIVAYFFFMIIKFIFAAPMMFIEDESAFSSLKKSYSATKKRMKESLVIFAIVAGVGLAFGFVGNTWSQAFIGIFSFENAIKVLFNIIVLILFFVISTAVYAFVRLFLFYSYLDFRLGKNGKNTKRIK